jgi:type II secretory pathway component GspD/PulD (secretin)
MEATVELPATVFVGSEVELTSSPVREKAGVALEVLAERIGPDHLVLRIRAWLRQVVAASSDEGPLGYPVLATREIDVRLTAQDRRSVVVGGLGAFERARSRLALPGLSTLPALDAVASARRRTSTKTELTFVVTPVIQAPGAPPVGLAPRRAPCAPCQSAAPKRPLDS